MKGFDKIKNFFKEFFKKKWALIAIAALAVVIVILVSALKIKNAKITETIESVISLTDIEKIGKVSSLECQIGGVAESKDGEPGKEKLRYYVKYTGTAVIGIDDISEIKISVDSTTKKVTFTLPKMKVINAYINNEKALSYMNMRSSIEKDPNSYSNEAPELCKKDIVNKINSEDEYFNTAKENLSNTIKGMFGPVIESNFPEYTVEVK